MVAWRPSPFHRRCWGWTQDHGTPVSKAFFRTLIGVFYAHTSLMGLISIFFDHRFSRWASLKHQIITLCLSSQADWGTCTRWPRGNIEKVEAQRGCHYFLAFLLQGFGASKGFTKEVKRVGEGVAEEVKKGTADTACLGEVAPWLSVHAGRTTSSVTGDLLPGERESSSRGSALLMGTPEHDSSSSPEEVGSLRVCGVLSHPLWTAAPSKSHSGHPATTSVIKIWTEAVEET